MKESSIDSLVNEVRDRLTADFQSEAEQLEKLEQALQEIREAHRRLEESVQTQLDILAQAEPGGGGGGGGVTGSLDRLLGSVRNLITSTDPAQVLDVLTEEAQQMGVRAAVFDVRGKAAWGAAARGFGSQLNEKVFRSVAVQLNQDNPFRQVYETGGHVDLSGDMLKKVKTIQEKLKPAGDDPVLLLPIRSAGAVSAIFYADAGGRGGELPSDGLKLLAEFAGAQLDRLMALSGAVGDGRMEGEGAAVPKMETGEPEPWEQAMNTGAAAEAPPPPAKAEPEAAPPPPAAIEIDLAALSEDDQKVHKDAKRFAKLLVSEIELYNKGKVAEGRKNKDVYKRLKADIDRSRQTFEKRFSKTAVKEADYFHEEVVRQLAGNDASALGSDYPGPSV